MDEDALFELVELATGDPDHLVRGLNSLHQLERKVMILRLGLADGRYWTLEEIALELGAPGAQLRLVETRGLAKLRDSGDGDGPAGVREPRRPFPPGTDSAQYASLEIPT